MNTKLSKEEWEAKQDILTEKTCEYTSLIRHLSNALYHHDDEVVKELKPKKKELWQEIQSLTKELGYPTHEEEKEER